MRLSWPLSGLITGVVGGGALIAASSYSPGFQLLGPVLAIIMGIVAGVLLAQNPRLASKTGGAGALAGLLAGVFLLIAHIVAAQLFIHSSFVQNGLSQVQQTVEPALTATAQAGGTTDSGGSTVVPVDLGGIASGFALFTSAILGIISLGICTGIGAASGAIAGSNNQAPQPPQLLQPVMVTPYVVPMVPVYPIYPQPGDYSAFPGGHPPYPGEQSPPGGHMPPHGGQPPSPPPQPPIPHPHGH